MEEVVEVVTGAGVGVISSPWLATLSVSRLGSYHQHLSSSASYQSENRDEPWQQLRSPRN